MRTRYRLTALVAMALLPAIGLSIALVAWNGTLQRDRLEASQRETLSALTLAIDGEMRAIIAAARALGTSPTIDSWDTQNFHRQAEALRAQHPNWRSIGLIDIFGQQYSTLMRPPGTPLNNLRTLDVFQTVLRTERPAVSDLLDGLLPDEKIIIVQTPIFRDDQLVAVVGVTMPPHALSDLLTRIALPSGWSAGIIDGQDLYIARIPHDEGYINTAGPTALRDLARSRGFGSLLTERRRSGEEILVGGQYSLLTDWVVFMAAPSEVVDAPLRNAYLTIALVGLPLLALGILCALAYGRQVTRALDESARASDLLIEQLRVSESRLRLLAGELNHRTKNVLQLVLVLVRRTKADSGTEAGKIMEGRIAALARAHAALAESQSNGTDLRQLVADELAPFRDFDSAIVIKGPPLELSCDIAHPLVMALHELTTNAAKYGGLAPGAGGLTVDWSMGTDGTLELTWSERSETVSGPPQTEGFGMIVVQQSLRQLGGHAEFTWRNEGLLCRMTIPATAFGGGMPKAVLG